jgi:hypothetical protein
MINKGIQFILCLPHGIYGGIGVSTLATNTMKVVNCMIQILPKNKIDPVVFKNLEKYKYKKINK